MVLLWCDGFDHYGSSPNGGRDAMLAGPWAEFGGTTALPQVSALQARTGNASLRFPISGSGNLELARRLFGADKAVVGVGFGLYMANLPGGNDRIGLQLRSAANTNLVTITFNSDASIASRAGSHTGTLLGVSGQVLTAAAWNHVEIRTAFSSTVGAIEARVNGVTVLDLSGLNIGNAGAAGVRFGNFFVGIPDWFIDDLFAWDDEGDWNNDFLGPQRVFTLLPSADTAQADWSVTGAPTGAQALDDVPPDGDGSYVGAADPADTSEFDLEDLPPEVSAVSAVYLTTQMRKTDAGTANVRQSLISGGQVAEGADRPITEVYTFWADLFETDPDTGAPWTGPAVNDMLLRLEKTA